MPVDNVRGVIDQIIQNTPAAARGDVQEFLRQVGAAQVGSPTSQPADSTAAGGRRSAAPNTVTRNDLTSGQGALQESADRANSYFQELVAKYPQASQEMAVLSSMVGKIVSSGAALNAVSAGGNMAGNLQANWGKFVTDVQARFGGVTDVNALVQQVLRESYLSTTEDLYFYAEKVKFFNEIKKDIRDELTAARKHMAQFAGKDDKDSITAWAGKGVVTDFIGQPLSDTGMSPALYRGEALDTKGKLDAYIKGLEEKLSSVGDDAQLANVDLQNILQKQQQTIQLMSNISKMLHDTGMAIVRKIGG
jgi:hypothetical protein